MKVPLTVMDNHDPSLLAELLAVVQDVANSGAFTGGGFVERFETAFASWCEADHAIGVSSGTEALVLVLRALGVRRDDEVIVPANSFIATAEAVWLAGATPRFADVDRDTQLVTAETLERAYSANVCGIIPVHLFGRTVEMTSVARLSERWGVWLVEDAAQAHGARYENRRVGNWSDAATFSFYPAKNLGAWGDAGAVVTNRADLADRIRLLRSHGEQPRYHHRMVGTTARLDAVQAAVLERKLARLDRWNAARRRVADQLRDSLMEHEVVAAPPPPSENGDHVYHQFVVRTACRDAFRQHLQARGVATAVHYPIPIHRSEAFRELDQAGEDVAPTASALAREICSLPIFPSMTADQLDHVAEAVSEFSPAAALRAA